jgi:hypothetical protein
VDRRGNIGWDGLRNQSPILPTAYGCLLKPCCTKCSTERPKLWLISLAAYSLWRWNGVLASALPGLVRRRRCSQGARREAFLRIGISRLLCETTHLPPRCLGTQLEISGQIG